VAEMARGAESPWCGGLLSPARVVLLVLAIFATHHMLSQWSYVNEYHGAHHDGDLRGGGSVAGEEEVQRLRAENRALRQRLEKVSPQDSLLAQVRAQRSSLSGGAAAALSPGLGEATAPAPPGGGNAAAVAGAVAKGAPPRARGGGCRSMPPFEPGDQASGGLIRSAGWHVNTPGGTGPVGFGGLDVPGPAALRVRLTGRGVARVRVQALRPSAVDSGGGLAMRLSGTPVVQLGPGGQCSIAVAYSPGDILEISTPGFAGGGSAFKLETLELLAHDCGGVASANAAPATCRNWERVRLPWTDCEDGLDSTHRFVRWVEGRISKVVNETHAIVQVPAPPSNSMAKRAQAAVFDPKSQLTSYQDEGTCGARGDDAKADLSSCQHGADLLKSVEMSDYNIVARIDGCQYFSYKVYACREETPAAADGSSLYRLVLPASQLAPVGEEVDVQEHDDDDEALAAPRCPGFVEEGRRIAIVLLGDTRFQAKYKTQIQSLKCFADGHGYELRILLGNEYEACKNYRDYFFRKHCTVAEWLESQPATLVAAIVDADVVAAVLERGLEKWANHPADVQLYQRCLLPEIMAGNYMVRNTPFSRTFLRNWAKYNFEMPKGFSSSDNGAIHLVVQDTVQVLNFPKCKKLYRGLDKPVTDLTTYFQFVKCTTDALGPPRDWRSRGGIVAVWPRFNFWAADGVYMSKAASREIGPLLHHGIKDSKDVTGHYYKNVSACVQNTENVIKSAAEIGIHAINLARGYKEYFPQGKDCPGTAIRQCPERCLGTFSCWPLGDQEKPLTPRTCTDCG